MAQSHYLKWPNSPFLSKAVNKLTTVTVCRNVAEVIAAL